MKGTAPDAGAKILSRPWDQEGSRVTVSRVTTLQAPIREQANEAIGTGPDAEAGCSSYENSYFPPDSVGRTAGVLIIVTGLPITKVYSVVGTQGSREVTRLQSIDPEAASQPYVTLDAV